MIRLAVFLVRDIAAVVCDGLDMCIDICWPEEKAAQA